MPYGQRDDSVDDGRRRSGRVSAFWSRRLTIAVVVLVGLLPLSFVADEPSVAEAQSATGSIRGRVDIRRILAAPQARPNVSALSSPTKLDAHDLQRAVVFLDGQDVPERSPLRTAQRTAQGRARMDQRNETFSPHVLAVSTGTFVDFPNNDQTFHNVFSLSKIGRFDLGRYGRNESKTVRFDKPGIVRVFCDIHSHMSAFVLVFNHPYHTTTNEDGRYRLDNVPPGTYTVTVWHEGQSRDTRSVTVPATGGVFDVDLLVQ